MRIEKEIEPGDTVRVQAIEVGTAVERMLGADHPMLEVIRSGLKHMSVTMKVMLITSIADAPLHQLASARIFAEAERVFGPDLRVLWLADPDLTFVGDGINGFPVMVTKEGDAMGLDGVQLEITEGEE